MKRIVIVFGLIAGLIVTGMMVYSAANCYRNADFKSNEIAGYTAMIVAFAFIFVGVKNFRDKYQHGVISFGKAFRIGLYITLIASTIYVIVWLIEYYLFYPDFMDKYCTHVLNESKAAGLSQPELDKKAKEMANFKEWYKNPLFVVLMTYLEIVPVGLVISLISALVLKRKTAAVS